MKDLLLTVEYTYKLSVYSEAILKPMETSK